jgi:hypothetical protein
MQVFGNVRHDSGRSEITRHNNFANFFHALMLLFRCATGESWQAVMLACKAGAECQPPYNSRQGGKGSVKCGSDLAYLYFCSFVFLSSFLVSLKSNLNDID